MTLEARFLADLFIERLDLTSMNIGLIFYLSLKLVNLSFILRLEVFELFLLF